jgi:hypothetical protein
MWYGRSGDLQESAGTTGQKGSVSFADDSEEGEEKAVGSRQLAASSGQQEWNNGVVE